MKIQPLHDRIVVQHLQEEEQIGGILIPDTAKEKPQKGKIIAVGKGKILDNGSRRDISLKVGDKVIFAKWSGSEYKIGTEEYLIMREEDILATIE